MVRGGTFPDCVTLYIAMAERSLVIVLRYGDQVPSMASCAKCQYKFFTPSDLRRDQVGAEMYLLDKFDLHRCEESSPRPCAPNFQGHRENRFRYRGGDRLQADDRSSTGSLAKNRHNACAVKGAGSLRVKVPPGNCSLHPVAIGAAVKETKPSEPPV